VSESSGDTTINGSTQTGADHPANAEPAILAKLTDVTRTGRGWMARCPAHDDHTPSLSVRVAEDGHVLVKCFAECTVEKVVAAVGMRMADLMPATTIVATYDYRDEHGVLLFQAVRLSPKSFRLRRQTQKGDWTWKLDGVRPIPYRLPELYGQRVVILVEGEKDADNLVTLGLPATTTPMGANASGATRASAADQRLTSRTCLRRRRRSARGRSARRPCP